MHLASWQEYSERKITVADYAQGYSTLGSQWLAHGMDENPVLTNAVVERVANETGRDAAQVVLRWALQHGQVSHSQSVLSQPYILVLIHYFYYHEGAFSESDLAQVRSVTPKPQHTRNIVISQKNGSK
jgi:diketogulonate reductase-like aldo/keto reductase